MKLPVDFGSKLFFRVFCPGVIIALALLRPTLTALQASGSSLSLTYVLIAQVLVFGSAFVVLDMPIYMLFEGRRFWPKGLWIWGMRRERERLARIHKLMRSSDAASRKRDRRHARTDAQRAYLEAAVEMSSFPLNPATGMPAVVWPTRLGNLIGAFEQYPRLKYGLDSVFFWPRLWVSIDKDLRSEIDSQQAQVDGLLYMTFALILSSLIMVGQAIVDDQTPGRLVHALPAHLDLGLAALCLAAAYGLYRASLPLHVQFGDTFKAVFDQHRARIETDDALDAVTRLTGAPAAVGSRVEHNLAVWRFLRWHRYRKLGETRNRRVRPS